MSSLIYILWVVLVSLPHICWYLVYHHGSDVVKVVPYETYKMILIFLRPITVFLIGVTKDYRVRMKVLFVFIALLSLYYMSSLVEDMPSKEHK